MTAPGHSGRTCRALCLAAVAGFACLAGVGLAPPEVRALRTPADRVVEWFPPGTELKGMTPEAFEGLLRAVRAGAAADRIARPARLVRARHFARWEDGVLLGRSELVVEPAEGGGGSVRLDPWTPALDPEDPASAGVGVGVGGDATGAAVLRLGADAAGATVAVRLVWRLRALGGPTGRAFTLGLPGVEPCRLTLDLPVGLEPAGLVGVRPDPGAEPAAGAGRATWVYDGRLDPGPLRLLGRAGGGPTPASPRLWVEGATRVDLSESGAAWTLEWDVRGGPGSPRRLDLTLDAGLDPLGVAGPEVESYQADPPSAGDGPTRLSVRFREPAAGRSDAELTTTLTVRAAARVPIEGRWAVPAARPLNAVWTGGRTTVLLDPSREVAGVRGLDAARVAGPAGESPGGRRFDFEGARPGPAAAFDFVKPPADVSATVAGRLDLGGDAPKLDARVVYRVDRGRPHSLDLDLPKAWSADRVEFENAGGPTPWHPVAGPGGGTRLCVTPPPGDGSGRPLVLLVAATAPASGGRGPLDLPRVRPAGVRLADETWTAHCPAGERLRPTRARGLAWTASAPERAAGVEAGAGAGAGAGSGGESPSLSWRWTDPGGEATVVRERSEGEARGRVELTAAVLPGRLRVTARVFRAAEVGADRPVVVGLSEPVDDPAGWRFTVPSTGEAAVARPLDEPARAAEGLTGRGPAWRVEVPASARGPVALVLSHDGPWAGRGRLPLVVLPAGSFAGGTAVVLAGRGVRTTAEAVGARRLDAKTPWDADREGVGDGLGGVAGAGADGAEFPGLRHDHAFAYDGPSASVELRSEALHADPGGGAIREARLTTFRGPQGSTRQRLRLLVAPLGRAPLGLKLPPSSVLERVCREGEPLSPDESGGVLSIPLAAAGPVAPRPLVEVTVDYRSGWTAVDPWRLRPERPWFSIPCLALSWDLVVPEPWGLARWGRTLTPSDPDRRRPEGPLALLAGGTAVGAATAVAGGDRGQAMLRGLDAREVAPAAAEGALGDRLTRWDGGAWPVVVDRVALAGLGVGPRSRVGPARPATDADGGPARAGLRGLGLDIVPVGDVLLVTTAAEVSRGDGPAAAGGDWASAVGEAAAWGVDATDRFAAAARWREEPTPRAPEAAAGAEGEAHYRFAAAGWPEADAEVVLVDRGRQAARGWSVGLAVLAAGLALARRGRARFVALTALVALAGATLAVYGPAETAGPAVGLLGGAAGLALFGLGRRLRPRWNRDDDRRPRPGRSATRVAAALSAALAVGGTVPPALGDGGDAGDDGPPVLALLVFDGPRSLLGRPDRVLLRLADHTRLQDLADLPARPRPPVLLATAVTHRVTWDGGANPVVESTLTLNAGGGGNGPARWSFPVAGSLALRASVDGVDTPIAVDPGGLTASVPVSIGNGEMNGAGRRLVLRRSVQPDRVGGVGEALSLPVNPAPTARLVVDRHPAGLRLEGSGARGRLDDPGPDGVSAWLGPVDRLDLRWRSAAPSSSPAVAPAAAEGAPGEALSLWDATPAGDRVRVRLTYRDPAGTSMVNVRLGPGVLVREAGVAGRSGSLDWQAGVRAGEWMARVDPPLPDGGTVTLDCWRPSGPRPDPSAVFPRVAPRVVPAGAGRRSGLLAFRRPPGWSGRLVPPAGVGPGVEAVPEEQFVRAWGDLPAESLALSGVVRESRSAAVADADAEGGSIAVRTGRPPARARVRPAVRLDVEPGRVNVVVDAELTEVSGPVTEAEVACPEGLRVVRVVGDGLAWWDAEGGRLRLRFDPRPAARAWQVRIEGWSPLATDPLAPAPGPREVEAPWPRWVAQDELPGLLTVSGPAGTRLVPGPGVEPLPPGPTPTAALRYRIDGADGPGLLRCGFEPAAFNVRVQSGLRVEAGRAVWEASLRYEVSGGPLDVINLKLPAEWARAATVRFEGGPHRRRSESAGGQSFWALRPEQPVWGSQRLVVRSTLPFPAGGSVNFPDLAPLGPSGGGGVETTLRVRDADGRLLSVEPSAGLEPVAPASLVAPGRVSGGASGPDAGAAAGWAYRVHRPGWSLAVREVGDAPAVGSGPGDPGVAHAEVEYTVAADGTAVGLGRYEVEPRPGPYLPVVCGPDAEPVWAAVGAEPTRLVRGEGGLWLVPLSGEAGGRVTLAWRTAPPRGGRPGSAPRPVALPVVGSGRVPTLVTVRTPPGVYVSDPRRRIDPTSPERAELIRARWVERETAAGLPRFDLGAARDGEGLVSALIRFELRLRQARRAAAWANPAARPDASPISPAADRLRDRFGATLAASRLGEFLAAAREQLGLPLPDRAGGLVTRLTPTPEPTPAVALPRLGRPVVYELNVGVAADRPDLVWQGRAEPAPTPADPSGLPAFTALALFVTALLATPAGRFAPSGRVTAGLLVLVLAVVAALAGPLWLVLGVGLAALGAYARV